LGGGGGGGWFGWGRVLSEEKTANVFVPKGEGRETAFLSESCGCGGKKEDLKKTWQQMESKERTPSQPLKHKDAVCVR